MMAQPQLTILPAQRMQVLSAEGPQLLLGLPTCCLLPNPSRAEPHINTILRHILEDPITLESWMESEVRSYMLLRVNRNDPLAREVYANRTNLNSRCDQGYCMGRGQAREGVGGPGWPGCCLDLL